MRNLLLSSILLLCAAPVSAQSDVPDVVTDGLAAYAGRGVDAALDVWLESWSDEDRAVARPQLRTVFQRFDEQAGPMLGYDHVGFARWGERAGRVYVIMLFENQPIYARFDVYRPTNRWNVVNVTVNTDPAQVFPPELFMPR